MDKMTENKPNKIIWHHSADDAMGHQAQKINAYHKSRGFPLSQLNYYGGYHYLIEKDGSIFQYRNENEIGAHDKDENINSLGICLAGNFNRKLPTSEQEQSLAEILDKLITKYQIPLTRIEPHRWGDTTDCPGTMLIDDWAVKIYAINKLSLLKRILLALLAKLN
jgi:hypothetical protein